VKAPGIEPHPHALLKGFDSDRSQGSLDSIITREPKRPHFTTRGLLDYIVQLIVCEDEAFRLIDQGTFRQMLKYCRPNLTDKDIPHRNTVQAEIMHRAHVTEENVRKTVKVR
jgi:hypothetical protein